MKKAERNIDWIENGKNAREGCGILKNLHMCVSKIHPACMNALNTCVVYSVAVDSWDYKREDVTKPGLWLFEVTWLVEKNDYYHDV